MAKLTKNRKISIEKVDSDKSYSLEEASSLVKEITTTKFDSSVDLAIRLGVDPKKPKEREGGFYSFLMVLGNYLKFLQLLHQTKKEKPRKAGLILFGLITKTKKFRRGWLVVE